MHTLEADIDEWVRSLLNRCKIPKIRGPKVIHDPILGSNVFEDYEIALVDTPFLQRLRDILQTDVALLTYPSANQNRLEHSLGVAVLTQRMIEALKRDLVRNKGTRGRPKEDVLDEKASLELRFAALLHDIGHGPFSHLTEDIYKRFDEVREYMKQHPRKFDPDKPHELLSYLIIKNAAFQSFFDEEIVKKYELPHEIDLDKVARMVIGDFSNDPDEGYKGDIINGPFDADKLDYLQRDCYFTGLKLGIDLERLLHCIRIDNASRRMAIRQGGITAIEQIMFNKILLHSHMYHHQKVRAAECFVKGVFELVHDEGLEISGSRMTRAVDFLNVTDTNFLVADGKHEQLQEYLHRFHDRRLFKRALVISSSTVYKPDESPGYHDLKKPAESPEDIRVLRQKLVDALGGKYPICDVWIDLPLSPSTSESTRIYMGDGDSSARHVQLGDIFPTEKWLVAYGAHKWRGHVFCRPEPDIRQEVGKTAQELLEEEFDIRFNEKALADAKL